MCAHVRARLQLTEHMPRLNPPLESRGYCAFPPGVWVLEWVRPMAFHDDPRGGARVLLRWVSAPVPEFDSLGRTSAAVIAGCVGLVSELFPASLFLLVPWSKQ